MSKLVARVPGLMKSTYTVQDNDGFLKHLSSISVKTWAIQALQTQAV